VVEVNLEGHGEDPRLEDHLRRAVEAALAAGGAAAGALSVTLLDDAHMSELNGLYLGHDGPTDVLSFALHEEGEDPIGDVYIGYDQALRQADEHGEEPWRELARLAIHGTLHVLGHDHPEGDERIDCDMWTLQEQVLEALNGR
jgi:probable rRNA maturation factor